MLQIKKIFLIFLSSMVFSLGISAKTLLMTSNFDMGTGNQLERTLLIERGLVDLVMDDVSSEVGRGIDCVLTEEKPNALIINWNHVRRHWFFWLNDLENRRVTDDELIEVLMGRGLNSPIESENRTIEFVFLNSCNSEDLCLRLQNECGIPVVVGWRGIVHALTAVKMSFMLLMQLFLGSSYFTAFHETSDQVKKPILGDHSLEQFLAGDHLCDPCMYFRLSDFYTEKQFTRPGGFRSPLLEV